MVAFKSLYSALGIVPLSFTLLIAVTLVKVLVLLGLTSKTNKKLDRQDIDVGTMYWHEPNVPDICVEKLLTPH